MGVVFLAEDRSGQRVAIKVLRPELATAVAIERFLRESRILSSIDHPNVVPVLRFGENDGLAWYAMPYYESPTLATLLKEEGRLPGIEARRIGGELLEAISAIHAHGIIHRDIKPSNIFLVDGHPVLGDFGLARKVETDSTALTEDGRARGTPAYMPPEQFAGIATPRTDQCAAAMVVYELYTGKPWSFDTESAEMDWNGMPIPVRVATRRALSFRPRKRFDSVDDYRRALLGRGFNKRRFFRRAFAAASVVLASWSIAVIWPPSARPMSLSIEPLQGAAGVDPSLGAALAEQLGTALRNAADLSIGGRRPDLAISGTVTVAGERVELTLAGRQRDRLVFSIPVAATRERIVDSAAVGLLLAILRASRSLPGDMPTSALPNSAAGLMLLAQAEARYARAEWAAADTAFTAAYAADSTCLICLQRQSMITRWMRRSVDPVTSSRLMSVIDSFPPHYRMMIRAGTAGDRWRRLDELHDRAREVAEAQFLFGDEVFHRGPLAGRARNDAIPAFQRALQLRPDFAPAWEHLAWAATAAGDRDLADSALRRYGRTLAPGDLTSQALHAVTAAGYAWRFGAPADAAQLTDGLLQAMAGFPDLVHGARYLLAFDAPAGAAYVGARFEGWAGRADLHAPGLAARIAAQLAMGRVDSARAAMGRLTALRADPELSLGAAGFETALAVFDGDYAAAANARALLEPLMPEGAAQPAQQRRAAFYLTLLTRRANDATAARTWRRRVEGEPGSRPLATLLDADASAALAPLRALTASLPLEALDSAGRGGDPFARAFLHLLRAEWHARAGNELAAATELRWHENSDFIGGTTDAAVQPVEADWALGTLARWNRARLLDIDRTGRVEACRAYGDVARLWAGGDPRFQARADSASSRRRVLACPNR